MRSRLTIAAVALVGALACAGDQGEERASGTSAPSSATPRLGARSTTSARPAPSVTTTSTTASTTTTTTSTTAVPAEPDAPVTPAGRPPPPPPTPRPPVTSVPDFPGRPSPPPVPPPPPSNPSIQAVTAADLHASWRPGCPVHFTNLRRVIVPFVDFGGAERTGALIVHQDHADAMLAVFVQLRSIDYPIQRIDPVDVFGGSDDASMAANNTSAFNCRAVTGGTGWSRHAYGTAIDINPVQNPYVRRSGGTVTQIFPWPSGAPYAENRAPGPGVITAGDGVVTAFAGMGWRWGGYWTNPVDYQHFDNG